MRRHLPPPNRTHLDIQVYPKQSWWGVTPIPYVSMPRVTSTLTRCRLMRLRNYVRGLRGGRMPLFPYSMTSGNAGNGLRRRIVNQRSLLLETRFRERVRMKGHERSNCSVNSRLTKSGSNWTIPNLITVGRLSSSPILGYFITQGNYELALGGLAIFSTSDWLDGYIARKYNMISVLGTFLDPMADKVMVASVSISLGLVGAIPLPLACLIVGRDALLIGGGLLYRARTRNPEDSFFDVNTLNWQIEPSILSKVNTALQFSTFWLSLCGMAYGFPDGNFLQPLWWTTGAGSILSGYSYFMKAGLEKQEIKNSPTRIYNSALRICHDLQVQQALQHARHRVVRKRYNTAARIHLVLKNDVGKVQESRRKVVAQEIRVLTRELKSCRNYFRYLQYQSRKFRYQFQRQQ